MILYDEQQVDRRIAELQEAVDWRNRMLEEWQAQAARLQAEKVKLESYLGWIRAKHVRQGTALAAELRRSQGEEAAKLAEQMLELTYGG